MAFCLNLLWLFDVWSDLWVALVGARGWALLCASLVCVLLSSSCFVTSVTVFLGGSTEKAGSVA